MTNRVLLNSQGLKVSNPGIDVLSNAQYQNIFCSDFSSFELDGYYEFTTAKHGSGGVSFGKDYGFVPLVYLSARNPSLEARGYSTPAAGGAAINVMFNSWVRTYDEAPNEYLYFFVYATPTSVQWVTQDWDDPHIIGASVFNYPLRGLE